ncbi:MAG: glycine cleavage system protein GcvH [Desulfatiglandaceae bacterium]
MKSIDELNLPEDCRYTQDHEWARIDGEKVRVGVSDYAQDQLGDIVFLELPQVGDVFKKGEVLGTVESVKAVSELYMPVGGEVIAVNSTLEDSPQLVNKRPYEEGWMVDVKPIDATEIDALLTRQAYLEMLGKGAE